LDIDIAEEETHWIKHGTCSYKKMRKRKKKTLVKILTRITGNSAG